MFALWRRLPVIIRAVLAGGAMAIAGTGPWALLSWANLKYFTIVPWSVPPTALYLWFFWRYAKGEGWPRAAAESRRISLRANAPADDAWGAALFAGILGLASVLLLLRVLSRLVILPREQTGDLSHLPSLTLLLILAMSAVVAGVVEETSFRGYMQGPIERRHGPVLAILVTGVMFGFMHFTHPEVTMAMMPYYMSVAAVYGALAWLTNSIYPGLALHAAGNFFSGLGLLAGGRSTLESPNQATLVWETGADPAFWISLVAFFAASAAAIWAFTALAGAARQR